MSNIRTVTLNIACGVGQIGLCKAEYGKKSGRAIKVSTDSIGPVLAACHKGRLVRIDFKLTIVHRAVTPIFLKIICGYSELMLQIRFFPKLERDFVLF